jgi:hypothetical protein
MVNKKTRPDRFLKPVRLTIRNCIITFYYIFLHLPRIIIAKSFYLLIETLFTTSHIISFHLLYYLLYSCSVPASILQTAEFPAVSTF